MTKNWGYKHNDTTGIKKQFSIYFDQQTDTPPLCIQMTVKIALKGFYL